MFTFEIIKRAFPSWTILLAERWSIQREANAHTVV